MIQLQKILVPTDFSEASSLALPHGFEIARRFASEITILHIRTPFSATAASTEEGHFDEEEYQRYIEKQLAEESMDTDSRVSVKTTQKQNISAAAGIIESIQEDGCDLVVMGSHGRSALTHFFLGSVTEKVVRYSPVPVLTVAPSREGYRRNPVYRRILATFDFSKHSIGAVLGAKEFADKYGARLEVLYVIEQEIRPGSYDEWKKSITDDLPAIEADARRILRENLGDGFLEEIRLHVEVGAGGGRAYREIIGFAENQKIDLVVMGTHGLSGVEHMLLGSTTERVVRTAPCPVLTFHLTSSEKT